MAVVRRNAFWLPTVLLSIFLCACALSATASVQITSPASGATVSSPVHCVASATSKSPISEMWVYLDGQVFQQTSGSRVDTYISLTPGTHRLMVKAIDSNGFVSKKSVRITVTGSTGSTVAVSVSPTSATVELGKSQQFTASVSGTSNTSVAWAVNGITGGNSTVGTVTADGFYSAPATMPSSSSVTISATSAADATKQDSASVSLTSPAPSVSVGVSPASASVQLGKSQQFTASVSGTSNTSVTWAVNGVAGGNSTVGTVNSSGLYTAPAAMPSSSSVTVSATSAADTTKKDSASVSLTTPTTSVSVAVSPSTASVQLGKSQQFTASVSGTSNTSVSWAVNGTPGGNSIVGTVSSSGNYTAPPTMPTPSSVMVSATSAADTTKKASASVGLTTPPPSSNASSHYGVGINADELANLRIGVDGSKVSLRFRAATSSTLNAVRLYVKTGSGYSGGTGGSWNIRLETDDGTSNHYPSGDALATTSKTSLSGGFPLISFSSPASLSEGEIYHLVISNGDPNPTVNFVSINNLVTFSMPNPLQPTMADSDWMTLMYNGGWTNNKKTPVLELDYGHGGSQGIAYVDAWASTRASISGSNTIRETFTVSGGDRSVESVRFRLARASGSSPLKVRLEEADGTLIEEGTVPASNIGSSDTWATYAFSGVRTLASGQSYNLVLSTASDTKYTAEAIQKGKNYGFASTTYFNDGYAQVNSGSGWSGVRSRTDADFQFFFLTQ